MIHHDYKQIRDKYKSGMTIANISRQVGCARATVYRALGDMLKDVPCGPKTKFSPARMKELYEDNYEEFEIAVMMSCSITTVRRGLEKMGVITVEPVNEKEYYKPPKTKRTKRICLKCDRKFSSAGNRNRLCVNCIESNGNAHEINRTAV